MMVKGQGILDALLFHDDKAGAVDDAPGLVRAGQVEFERGMELFCGLANLDAGSAVELSGGFTRQPAEVFALAAGEVKQFGQDHFRCDHLSVCDAGADLESFAAALVPVVDEGYPVTCVCEDLFHFRSAFGWPYR